MPNVPKMGECKVKNLPAHWDMNFAVSSLYKSLKKKKNPNYLQYSTGNELLIQ